MLVNGGTLSGDTVTVIEAATDLETVTDTTEGRVYTNFTDTGIKAAEKLVLITWSHTCILQFFFGNQTNFEDKFSSTLVKLRFT